MFDLTKEITYNLALIYQNSGAPEYARMLLYRNCVIWRCHDIWWLCCHGVLTGTVSSDAFMTTGGFVVMVIWQAVMCEAVMTSSDCVVIVIWQALCHLMLSWHLVVLLSWWPGKYCVVWHCHDVCHHLDWAWRKYSIPSRVDVLGHGAKAEFVRRPALLMLWQRFGVIGLHYQDYKDMMLVKTLTWWSLMVLFSSVGRKNQ